MKQPSKQKIDDVRRFLKKEIRRYDDSPYEASLDLIEAIEDPFAALAWLAVYDSDAKISEQAGTMLFTALEGDDELGVESRASVLPVILAALKDKAVPDDRKVALGPLLEMCGHEISNDEYISCFKDFEAATAAVQEKLGELEVGLAEAEQMLTDLKLWSPEGKTNPNPDTLGMAMVAAQQFGAKKPELAAALACFVAAAAERHSVQGIAADALEFVRDECGSRGAWFLSVLASMPAGGEVSRQAAALVTEMRGVGILPDQPRAGEFTHGLLTNVDGTGTRSMMLFFRSDEGEMDATSFLINEETGIKDYWIIWGQGANADDEMHGRTGLSTAPCNLELAREIVGDALAIHAEKNLPPPLNLLLGWHMLGREPIRVERRTPRLGSYMVESIVRSKELADESDALLDSDLWAGMLDTVDPAYEFMRKARKQFHCKGRKLARKVCESPLFDEYLKLMESRRDNLIRRMAMNLELESLGGRAKDPINRLACFTWVVLSENLEPFDQIPFVRGLAQEEIEAIAQDLKKGFNTADQAKAALIRQQLEAEGLMDDEWEMGR